ncbi:MAG: carbohydrate ABC transporter permease [Bacillota bacterium]|nr:carbohydrate ABC transporter permease [Bacillota bacterium]
MKYPNKSRSMLHRRAISSFFKYLILSICMFAVLAPFFYIIYASLQTPAGFAKGFSLRGLTLQNYIEIVKVSQLFRWYFNTFLVTGIVILGNLILGVPAGYALARFSFRGKDLLFTILLGVMIIPIQSYLIPLYVMMSRLNWLNTYLSVTVPIIVYPFCIFFLRQFYLTIPKDIEDAAKIDGLGPFGTLIRIVVPLSKGALATVTILSLLWTWNNLVLPATMINDPDYYVLTVGLNTLKNVHYSLPTLNMAGVVYMIAPIMIGFLFFQRYFIESMISTGLKY